jgi:putative lipoprotein (rSAM/lipoprotein system)
MLKNIKRIFIFILGFFLFSCDTVQKNDQKMNLLKLAALISQNPVPVFAEYGMPHAWYTISGSVVDESANPIQDIQVSFCDMITQSDESGNWSIDSNSSFCPKPHTLQVEDVDGDQNGSFEDAQVTLNLVQTEPENRWYEGKFEQSGVAIILETKTK